MILAYFSGYLYLKYQIYVNRTSRKGVDRFYEPEDQNSCLKKVSVDMKEILHEISIIQLTIQNIYKNTPVNLSNCTGKYFTKPHTLGQKASGN